MTEKRFINHDDTIMDNQGEQLISTDEIVEKLNELNEDNENITLLVQHNYEESKRIINNYVDKIKELEKENKELKTFKDKVFALIDARIEIYKRKPFMAPVSAPMSVNFDEDTDRLARLSELEQLKKELSESE